MYNSIISYIGNFYIEKYNSNKQSTIYQLEFILYIRIYIIYLFLYYLKQRKILDYSFCLNGQYLIYEIYKYIENKISYQSKYDVHFLTDITNNGLITLINLIIYFDYNILLSYKLFLFGNINCFYYFYKMNKLYKKRLKCIEESIEFNDPLKILFFNPNKKYIQMYIEKTNIFSLYNFCLFINIIIFFFF